MMESCKVCITDEDNGVKNVSFQYLLWFQPSLWALIIQDTTATLLLDGRYFWNTDDIDSALISKRLKTDITLNYVLLKWDIVDAIIQIQWEKNTLYYLEDTLTYRYIHRFQNTGVQTEVSAPFFNANRAVKQNDEIKNIKQAIKIIAAVYRSLEEMNKKWEIIGKSEMQIRQHIVAQIFQNGWSAESFPAIVAFWENSAIPHHNSGETIISQGVLLIDMWAIYKGYCSDFSRTFWVWEKSGEQYDKFIAIHTLVQTAHDAAIQGICIGATTSHIDAIARDIITQAWYGELFIHSTGHGVGLDVHELPWVSPKSQDIIERSMVFTVEPWIYIPGEFWVRIEDIIIVH